MKDKLKWRLLGHLKALPLSTNESLTDKNSIELLEILIVENCHNYLRHKSLGSLEFKKLESELFEKFLLNQAKEKAKKFGI